MAKGDLRRTGRGLRHTGEVEVRDDDIAGLAVTIAKRVRDLAGAEGVLVSETVGGLMVGSYEHQHLVTPWGLLVAEYGPSALGVALLDPNDGVESVRGGFVTAHGLAFGAELTQQFLVENAAQQRRGLSAKLGDHR